MAESESTPPAQGDAVPAAPSTKKAGFWATFAEKSLASLVMSAVLTIVGVTVGFAAAIKLLENRLNGLHNQIDSQLVETGKGLRRLDELNERLSKQLATLSAAAKLSAEEVKGLNTLLDRLKAEPDVQANLRLVSQIDELRQSHNALVDRVSTLYDAGQNRQPPEWYKDQPRPPTIR